MSNLRGDLRQALRMAVRQPLTTLVVAVTLALGIGAVTTIFGVVWAVVVRPLPYEEPARLVTVWQDLTRIDGPSDEWASWDNFADWRRSSKTVTEMAAIGGWRPTVAGRDGEPPEQLSGGQASWNVLEVLGRPPQLGTSFDESVDRADGERVVLIGHSFWHRRFGGQTDIVGKSFRLDNQVWTIVGVLSPDLDLPFVGPPDVLAPLQIDESNSCGRNCVTLRVVGRLAPSRTTSEAQAELATIASALEQAHPDTNVGHGIRVIPLADRVTGNVRTPLLLLLGAVAVLLLIACANVAGVQLARTLARRREIAVRLALGARRGQLVQSFFVESLVLALLGGVGGIGLAFAGLEAVRRAAGDSVPRLLEAGIDLPTLVAASVVTILTAVTFGVLPALEASGLRIRAGDSGVASATGRASAGPAARRTRALLVVAEVALAVVLLIGAGLIGRSLAKLWSLDLGFQSENALVARIALTGDVYNERAARFDFSDQLLERLRSLPGVVGVAHTNAPPLAGNDGDTSYQIEGAAEPEPADQPFGWVRSVDDGYFKTMGIPLLSGRTFSASDREGAPDVLVVNEATAKRYFGEESALGKRINMNATVRWREIVGVVADTRHFGLVEPARPAVYIPYQQSPFGAPYVILRSDKAPLSRAHDVRAAVAELDPNLAVAEVTTLDELVGQASATESLLAGMLAIFAAVALLLAAIGLYGVISHGVQQQRRELGIRLALGAQVSSVIQLVLAGGLKLALFGAAIGLAIAAVGTRLVASQLYEVDPFDPLVWTTVPVALLAVASLALLAPAWRAARIDVQQTLRNE